MKRILSALLLIAGLGFGVSACANTETRVLQGIFALDETFSMTQELAIAVLGSNVLTTEQRTAIKATDHFIAEELKALTDKAIAVQKGQSASISSADYEKAKSDLASFKGVLAALHGGSDKTSN